MKQTLHSLTQAWLRPNSHGERPGDFCCEMATGKFCYDHDPDNYPRRHSGFGYPAEPESGADSELAVCETRAIDLYYQHKDDKETTCDEVRAKLVSEFSEETVAQMLRNGIGNNPSSHPRSGLLT